MTDEMTFEEAMRAAAHPDNYSTRSLREAFNILIAPPACENIAELILQELKEREGI